MTPRHAEPPDDAKTLRARLADAEDMLQAIRQGEIDALVVEGDRGSQVYTLHSAEEPYRQLVEQMQEGAVVLTGRGDIVYANARFAAMVGEPLESVLGSRLERFVKQSDRSDFQALLSAGTGRQRSRLVGADPRAFEVAHAKGAPAALAREVISRQVGHISHLIEELLDVERVVSGKIRLARRSLDLAAAVRQAVATFTSDTRLDRQIEVTTEPIWVEWDAVRLDQVLSNLIRNAVKYSPSGGRIRVALRQDADDAVLSVEDSGFGITPRLLPFIFDMYAQAARTLDRAEGGLGIGLTLVRRLVEL